MERLKIDYGIDLGTTNSSICRMEKGSPVVIKSDILKDTMPSCVSINKKGSTKVGDAAYNTMKSDKRRATKSWEQESSNTYIEFKRTMGTDKEYQCANLNKSLTSEELSAEVLKALKAFVTDEQFNSVVITVPAKFTVNQKTATLQAAKMAGFTHVELLQEPIAASYAYGLTSDQKNGVWMVFDFGGGTFDAALLKVEDGIMQVFDTEGDNYLGGKDLDAAIVDKIIIPYLKSHYKIDNILADKEKNYVLREAMKTYAEDVKNVLSFKEREDILSNIGDLGEDDEGEEIELDLSVDQNQINDAMRPVFQKAVDICKTLMMRNNLSSFDLNKLILVGGPTHSPLLRQMLRDQVTFNVTTDIDPMTAVATGAALYASTIDNKGSKVEVADDVIQLQIGYEPTTVELCEWVSIKLDHRNSPKTCPEKIKVELVRSDNAWSSGKSDIDRQGNVLLASLVTGRSNTFVVNAYDTSGRLLNCFPSQFSILQGTRVGAALLPYYIGIAKWDEDKEKAIFMAAKGLEKNKTLPAKGVINGLKTTQQLRPGVSTDVIRIPVYQCDDQPELGRTAELYEYVSDVLITGDEISTFIPRHSLVDLTLIVDSSEQMTLEAYFSAVDITVTKVLMTDKKQSEQEAEEKIEQMISLARKSIYDIEDNDAETTSFFSELSEIEKENRNNSERKRVLQNVKKLLRKIEDKDRSYEWDRVYRQLTTKMEELKEADKEYGDESSHLNTKHFASQIEKLSHYKDVKLAKELLGQMKELVWHLTAVFSMTSLMQQLSMRFYDYPWTNEAKARQLINKGVEISLTKPSRSQLYSIVEQLTALLPEKAKQNLANGLLK